VNGRKVVLEERLWEAHAQSLPVHLTLYGVGSGFGMRQAEAPNPFDGPIANDFEIAVTDSENERYGNLNFAWH
jgi:hypothetical protein